MKSFIDAFERIPCKIFDTPAKATKNLAILVAQKIEKKREQGEHCVLGLATGASPIQFYQHLVKLYQAKKVSFSNVIVFNLDEYYPIEQDDEASYNYFLHHHLFKHIDIKENNIHLHKGTVAKEELKTYCADYEKKIESVGGIDIQILGVGHNGHIGFNEPGSSYYSKTRLISLSESSRIANSIYFSNFQDVPRLAITMGLQTILNAKNIYLLAWGVSKAKIIQAATELQPTEQVPASLLQQHDKTTFYLDDESASELTRNKKPWLTGSVEWTTDIIKKAVIDMALGLEKPILSLTHDNYVEHGLMDLFIETGKTYFDINLQIFHLIRHSITGWPGGKAEWKGQEADIHPERAEPTNKKVIIFSPHPDDDIISMGGTMQRLYDHKHEVHIAYQTSGNIAVNDSFLLRLIRFVGGVEQQFKLENDKSKMLVEDVIKSIASKGRNQIDAPKVREVKGLIRKYEALSTCEHVGIPNENTHFLNLPFYETGRVEKGNLSREDIEKTKILLKKIQPHQIYLAGDWADPHGTHKVCFDITLMAIQELRDEGEKWVKDCWMWLYKGAWQEWDIDQIQMAIPMSPEQVISKRNGILIHQSQKDNVPFPGSDKREFWERAEERNNNTAQQYAQLGMPQYAAIEGFVRYHY